MNRSPYNLQLVKFFPFIKIALRRMKSLLTLRLTFTQCKKAVGFLCQCHLPCATSQTGLICEAEKKRTDPPSHHLPKLVKLIHVANRERAIPLHCNTDA